MEDRARRIGENEIVYRAINEKIEDLNKAFGMPPGSIQIICECGDLACTERIQLDIGTYEHIRSDPTFFAVLPGHEIDDVERVVEEHERYRVVCKDEPEAAELARDTDPRG